MGDLLPLSGELDPRDATALAQLGMSHPGLFQHLDKFHIARKANPEKDDRQLEYYPPWEEENPIPGKPVVHVYNQKAKGEELSNLLGGEVLHYMGAVDPNNGKAIDPTFRKMKDSFLKTFTPDQLKRERKMYDRQVAQGWQGSFDQFLDSSRADEYLMGWLFPDKEDEWRKQGAYTGEQMLVLADMEKYLKSNKPTTPQE